MKKFLVILMVVAMASFLFTGCIPTAPEAEEEVVPEEVVPEVVKTDTPTITSINSVSLYSTATQYTDDIFVGGVSVKDATIKLYVDDTLVGVAVTGDTASFATLSPSLAEVTEGVVELYVTATGDGLAESDASTKYTFTFDETAPTLASAIADSGASSITVTFSEDVSMALSTSVTGWPGSALNYLRWTLGGVDLTDIPIARLSGKVVRITTVVAGSTVYAIGCTGVEDLAGNAIATESVVATIGIP